MCRMCDEGKPQDHTRAFAGSRRDFLKASTATAVAATGLNLLTRRRPPRKTTTSQGRPRTPVGPAAAI